LLLDAGQEAEVENTGHIVPIASPDIEARIAWRQRRLEFRSATVAEIAAEYDRYNRTQTRALEDFAVCGVKDRWVNQGASRR
jgi:ferric-dicitrate binding protein FerR (iron transport regulator)